MMSCWERVLVVLQCWIFHSVIFHHQLSCAVSHGGEGGWGDSSCRIKRGYLVWSWNNTKLAEKHQSKLNFCSRFEISCSLLITFYIKMWEKQNHTGIRGLIDVDPSIQVLIFFFFLKRTIFVHSNITFHFQNLSSLSSCWAIQLLYLEAYLCRWSLCSVAHQQNKHGSRSNESILFQSDDEAECRPLVNLGD